MPPPVLLDGLSALEDVLGAENVLPTVARYAVFLHPQTVAQAGRRALFPIIRAEGFERRGSQIELAGSAVITCDNLSPTHAFLWAAGRSKGPDIQFNHIWPSKRDPSLYTALWNLCVTPAFLAKLTDNHPAVVAAIRCRAHDLYGCLPEGQRRPPEPTGYASLQWAPHPPAVANVEAVFRGRMATVRSSRCTVAATRIGWTFSGFNPDPTV